MYVDAPNPTLSVCSCLQCSQSCGTGYRLRNVTCSRNTGVDCDPRNKPLSVTACHIQVCVEIVDNFGGIEWSGSGWSSSEVLNEINLIPEVKPPPKHSPTRGQPRTHKDRNYIDNGDFNYHNIIENNDLQEISVPVDDFYYDYNFINFHEDLSHDFESDENSEGSNGFGLHQEAKPTHSMEENSHMGATRALNSDPTTTLEVQTLTTQEPQSTKTDCMKTSLEEANEENLDTILSEDHLLPVSPTRLSPKSTTEQSQKLEEKGPWWPEISSSMPSLLFTTKQPALHETWSPSNEEDNHSEHLTVTLTSGAPTPRHQTTDVATTVSFLELVDDYISAEQEATENSEWFGSPSPTAATQVRTELDNSKIPQTTSLSTKIQVAFTVEDLDFNSNHFSTSANKFWYTNSDLTRALPPSSEDSSPPPTTFFLVSGHVDTSDDNFSLTGTENRPNTKPQEATEIPAADLQTATMDFTYPVFPETTGINPTSQSSLFQLKDLDHDEISVPSVVGSSINSQPGTSKVTSATPKHSSALATHRKSPAAPVLPTRAQRLWPNSVQTSASPHVSGAAFWVAGNWSTVSLFICVFTFANIAPGTQKPSSIKKNTT